MNDLKKEVSSLRNDIRELVSKRVGEIQNEYEVGISSIDIHLLDITTVGRLAKTGCHEYVVGNVEIDLEV